MTYCLNTMSDYKHIFLHGLSEPEFYGDLLYKCRKNIGKNDILYHFKKIIVRFIKRLVITYMFCDRLHAWFLLTSLIARR